MRLGDSHALQCKGELLGTNSFVVRSKNMQKEGQGILPRIEDFGEWS